jgi:hypothetical protein
VVVHVTSAYTAYLGHMEAPGKLRVYETIFLAANADDDALKEAVRWVERRVGLVKGETWLLIEQGARRVRCQRLGETPEARPAR